MVKLLDLYYLNRDSIFPKFKIRPMIKYIKENFTGSLRGAEIGIARGDNLQSILYHLDIKYIFAIDKDLSRVHINDDRIIYLQKNSLEAHHLIDNLSLDFVYIDSSHKYNNLIQELFFYFPKISYGGILGGHDYTSSTPQVIRAVDDFLKELPYRMYGYDKDWWILKR